MMINKNNLLESQKLIFLINIILLNCRKIKGYNQYYRKNRNAIN